MEYPARINFISFLENNTNSFTNYSFEHLIMHETIKNSNGTLYKYIIYIYSIYLNIKNESI